MKHIKLFEAFVPEEDIYNLDKKGDHSGKFEIKEFIVAGKPYDFYYFPGTDTVRLYRIENKKIPYDWDAKQREGIYSKKEILGGWFTNDPDYLKTFIQKNQSRLRPLVDFPHTTTDSPGIFKRRDMVSTYSDGSIKTQVVIEIEGINLVYVDILSSDLDKYHVSKNDYTKNMDQEPENWIIPLDIKRSYADLSSLTKVTGNPTSMHKAMQELKSIIDNLPTPQTTPG